MPDRSSFEAIDTIRHIWLGLGLPESALALLEQTEPGRFFASSFKVDHLAQSSIALSALAAALVHSVRTSQAIPKVTIPGRHASQEFVTERLYTIDGKAPQSVWGPIGGLHQTADGYVRIHDSFPNHRNGTLALLGADSGASREDVALKVRQWGRFELEEAAARNKLAIYALRSFAEWDATPQAAAVQEFPIHIRKISDEGPNGFPAHMSSAAHDRCLRGLRVLELSRVIAAPVAGKTLAAHGADVLWVTSPHLPDLPSLDRCFSRGKRSIQLDLESAADRETLKTLVQDADVFLQGYRPGSLAAKGFSPAELSAIRPGLIYANLSAFGREGPWSDRRGFDSLVQTCSGMNVSEAEHYGDGSPARPMPCQALDHASGYFLAAGISAALYKRAGEGGSWEVSVSLAGVMKYLRSLGQYPGTEGFDECTAGLTVEGVGEECFESRDSGFGRLRALKHAAVVEGAMPGWDHMPQPLGSAEAGWSSPLVQRSCSQ